MITLPTNHPYFFTCPSCGCKLISVSTGNRAKPHCPKCDYSADDAFVVKDRVTSEAMNEVTKMVRFYTSNLDEACDALDLYDIDYDLDDGDRIMVDDSLYDDALDAFDEYDIEYEEV